MTDTYEVGEVAIYTAVGSQHHGCEVTVTGALEMRAWMNPRGATGNSLSYEIVFVGDAPDDDYVAEPHELRKRRPPQDWVKLCRLNEEPVEELA